MSLFRIAWRSIQQRGLASLLTALSMALGVMLVVAVLSIHHVVSESFRSNASLGYNVIIGAKGGKLQLTLNTVYYLSQPVENIPYEYYLEYLPAAARRQEQADTGSIQLDRDGRFSQYVDLAIPVCLGDYYGRFRCVGTTPAFFDQLRYGPKGDQPFVFAQGRNFVQHDAEHGYFEAVVGATVAREHGLKLGSLIQPTHGDPDGHSHDDGFTVVGILKQSGTPNDRAVFVNMEGFYLLADHAKPVPTGQADADHDHADHDHADHDHADHDHAGHDHCACVPLPLAQREVTAILLRTRDLSATPVLHNLVNEGPDAQAVLPVLEIYNLLDAIVGPIQTILVVLTAMICIVSGISILISIYNSMSERRHEIAVMRALGAGRDTVMLIILLESMVLALGGGLIGWFLAHMAAGLASPLLEAQTGVAVGFFDVAWIEVWLLPALLLLAVACGFFPAISAYRTDVVRSLND